MQKSFFLIFFFIFLHSGILFSQSPVRIPVTVGENTFYIETYEKAGEGIAYVHVHENETASLEAGKHIWNRFGGKLITLVHSFDGTKNRNVTFTWKKTVYKFDPNRIYTKDKNVLKNNISVVKGKGEVDDFIIEEVEKLARIIWAEVADFSYIIALHNNKNEPGMLVRKGWFSKKYEPESFSIISYIKKNDESSDSNLSCEDIYINPRINNSEFFIVTERRDFSLLYRKRYNVVLQNNQPIDDGSLSVFALQNSIRYVNSEAKMGRVKEQIEMLTLLFE